jgi:AraC family L-rhamnose operon transcriptional activator RhaR/AraC family L-rhamnose operon regulatory protein RhaS
LDISKKKDWLQRDGFPLSILRFNPQPPLPLTPHIHDFSELVVITGGQGRHVSGRSSYTLSAGDVFVISGSRSHNYVDMKELCLINILFDPQMMSLDQWDLMSLPGYHALFTLEPNWRKSNQFNSRLHISGRDLGTAIAMVDQLDNELTRRGPGFQALSTAIFTQLVVFLSRRYQQATLPDARALLRLGGSMAHLEQSQNSPVNLDDLARMAHMSKRNFLRAFKMATGTSPIKHRLQLRVARAAADLRQSKLSITQIAFDHGFNDSNYFSRQFRQVMGLSPREYRRRFL